MRPETEGEATRPDAAREGGGGQAASSDPSAAFCPASLLASKNPSPQNKWLGPTHFKLQGTGNQKTLSCFLQLVF